MTKIILFGDSITAGYLGEAASPVLTNLVKKGLSDQGYQTIDVRNAGIPGDTTAGGVKRLEKDVLSAEPDIVTIFFGANDCAQYCPIDTTTYGANLAQLIEKIGAEKVILLTPPYIEAARQPDRPTTAVCQYVEKAKEIGAAYRVPTVDLYQTMHVYPGVEEFLQADGLHFSEVGYDFLAALIVREIKGKLSA